MQVRRTRWNKSEKTVGHEAKAQDSYIMSCARARNVSRTYNPQLSVTVIPSANSKISSREFPPFLKYIPKLQNAIYCMTACMYVNILFRQLIFLERNSKFRTMLHQIFSVISSVLRGKFQGWEYGDASLFIKCVKWQLYTP